MTVDISKTISEIMIRTGFLRITYARDLYVVESFGDFNPSFFLRPIRKSGKIRLGGAFGIFCPKFEEFWRGTLLKSEIRIDNPLTLVSHTDNFVNIIDKEFYEYIDGENDLRHICDISYNFLSRFPKNDFQIRICVKKNNFLGRKLSEMVNIAEYYEIDNIYQRKSANFLFWLVEEGILSIDQIYNSLRNDQVNIMKRIENSRYFLF